MKKANKITAIVGSAIAIITTALLCGFLIPKSSKSKLGPSDAVFSVKKESVARAIQLDVDQADCGLIQISKDNSFETKDDNFDILVDAGLDSKSGRSKASREKLIKRLEDYGVSNIELIVLSHFHYDHIAAVKSILDSKKFSFNKTQVLYNFAELKQFEKDRTKTTRELIETLEKKSKASEITLVDSHVMALKDNNKMVSFVDENDQSEQGYFAVVGGTNNPLSKKNQNAWSVINRMEWRTKSMLYTGDLAGRNNENGINPIIPEKNYAQLDCDILKSPHHGSPTEFSNNMEFLKMVSPEEIWISAGLDDKYGLPRTTVLERYLKVLPDNDPTRIKGTNPFGDGGKSDITHWKELAEWIKKHPSVNNNNKGHGDIKYFFK